jgi:hypothetical protein
VTRRVEFRGGPDDGAVEHHDGHTHDVGLIRGHYRADRIYTPRDGTPQIWHYRWDPPRTGLRNPCRAGDESGCGGGRCPSGRSRQTT